MLPSKNPTQTEAWKKLGLHFQKVMSARMIDFFAADPNRFEKFSLSHQDLLVDISKNRITEETLHLLFQLAEEVQLRDAMDAMFSGQKINATENRSVLHVALRDHGQNKFRADGKEISKSVEQVLERINVFSGKINDGSWKGFSGKKITDIVNIGIGGSDLGPALVCEALTPYHKDIKPHFVSNVDGAHISDAMKNLSAETTMFIISSKTFTTQETMTNAWSAREWFLKSGKEEDISKHFVAVSTNIDAAIKFGIDSNNVFEFWDWVGGRFSVWSAIGLSIACVIGFDNFRKFLDGADSMDQHFQTKPFQENIPVVLAMIGIWYANFFKTSTEAIVPYAQHLEKLVSHLQQVSMESNGKTVDRNGDKINYPTCPVLFGGAGTNGQHSFFQLLHQGSQMIPCDFIGIMKSHHPLKDHHEKLLANFFGQTRALLIGRTIEEVSIEMRSLGFSESEIKKIGPHKVFEGNRPSNSLIIKELNPYSLGMLLAMYEHKVFVQGIVWNVFSFDQWGVELGKQLAGEILPALLSTSSLESDASTLALISHYRNLTK